MLYNLANAPRVSFSDLRLLPETSGVYVVLSAGEVVYVGQTVNFKSRWLQHHRKPQLATMKSVEVCYFEMSKDDAVRLEKLLIKQLNPSLNESPTGKPANRLIVTGWRVRHDEMLMAIFENLHPKLRAAFADDDGRMNTSAMIRYCVQEVHNRMTDEAEKGGKE